jgi:8-oxo-dGTP pyrophosphatase MutT (NUDIX family)
MTDLLDVSGDNPWQTLTSSVIYDNGWMRVLEDKVIQPDGGPGRYAYVQVPWPVVAVVTIDDNGGVYLVRQWRYPWRRNSWEIPAGRGEVGEAPLAAAQRELAEETGVHASSWEPLGEGFGSAAIDAYYHLYLARGLSPTTSDARPDDAEADLITRVVPLETAVEAAMDGRIVHAFTIVGLLRAARRLGV